MNKKEYILCSAIHFDDGIEYAHQPNNIKTGYVICGMRHHNCFMTLAIISNRNETQLDYEKEQGFLTNINRFVDRKEGMLIAVNSGQVEKSEKLSLYSEDLY